MSELYNSVKASVEQALSEACHMSVTTDIWTSTNGIRVYISLTAHWVTTKLRCATALLYVQHFKGSHTAGNIAVTLEQMLGNWDLQDKFHLIINHNAANAVKASKDEDLAYRVCTAHTLQLVVGEALKSQ